MNEATFTFQVDESLKDQPTDDAEALFRRQVQAGLESASAGRLVSAEEVEAEFSARRERTQRNIAAHS